MVQRQIPNIFLVCEEEDHKMTNGMNSYTQKKQKKGTCSYCCKQKISLEERLYLYCSKCFYHTICYSCICSKVQEAGKELGISIAQEARLYACNKAIKLNTMQAFRKAIPGIDEATIGQFLRLYQEISKKNTFKLMALTTLGGASAGAAAGGMYGATVGTAILPIGGTIVGGAVGLALGTVTGFVSSLFLK